jgi:uncharacterized membrane protein
MKRRSLQISEQQLALGLGWFSIALGLAQLAAPRACSRLIGLKEKPGLMRLFGLRELTAGIGILSRGDPTNWMWTRVAGDALDLAVLGSALTSKENRKMRVAAAAAAVAGVTAMDALCSLKLQKNPAPNIGSIKVKQSITIDKPKEELYRFWRNFEQLPQFMNHLIEVKDLGGNRSHWKARGPAGSVVEWDAEIINDHPNSLIAWQSLPGADVDSSGTVRFEPAAGNRGTIVTVTLQYHPPAGTLGAAVAKLFGEDPDKQIHVELHRFKQLMETGEIAQTEGQSV